MTSKDALKVIHIINWQSLLYEHMWDAYTIRWWVGFACCICWGWKPFNDEIKGKNKITKNISCVCVWRVTPPPIHVHAIYRSFLFFIVSCMIKSCNSLGRPGWALKKPLMQDIGAYCIYYLGRFNCIVQVRSTFVNP